MHDWPTLWFSLLVAIVCYALLGVMVGTVAGVVVRWTLCPHSLCFAVLAPQDPILASGVTSRVYIVRALVILLWLAHLVGHCAWHRTQALPRVNAVLCRA